MNQILESATVFKIIAFPRKDSVLYLSLFSLFEFSDHNGPIIIYGIEWTVKECYS